MTTYIQSQLARLGAPTEPEHFNLKIHAPNGCETNWLNVSPKTMEQIAQVLLTAEAESMPASSGPGLRNPGEVFGSALNASKGFSSLRKEQLYKTAVLVRDFNDFIQGECVAVKGFLINGVWIYECTRGERQSLIAAEHLTNFVL